MTDSLFANDRPITDFNFRVTSFDWLHTASRSLPTVGFVGRGGADFVEQGTALLPRVIPLSLNVRPATLAQRRTWYDALWAALEGEIEIRVADDPTRVLYGMLQEGTGGVAPPAFIEPGADPVLSIVCANPAWTDRYAQLLVAANANQPKTVPCGTAPHGGRIWVRDGASSRTVSVLNFRGETVCSMTLTGSLSANHYLEIDCDNGVVWDVTGITKVDVTGTWTQAGTDDFPVFDPRDKPMIQHSGSGDIHLLYRRNYR